MSELKVIDVDKMADVRSLSGQFYLKTFYLMLQNEVK